jgi:hypothetical protein
MVWQHALGRGITKCGAAGEFVCRYFINMLATIVGIQSSDIRTDAELVDENAFLDPLPGDA